MLLRASPPRALTAGQGQPQSRARGCPTSQIPVGSPVGTGLSGSPRELPGCSPRNERLVPPFPAGVTRKERTCSAPAADCNPVRHGTENSFFSSQLKGASQQVLAGGAFCGGLFLYFLVGDPRVRIPGAHLCARRARPAGGAPGPAQVDPAPSLPFPSLQIPGFCPWFIPLSRLCAVSWTSQLNPRSSSVSPAAASAPCGVFPLCFMRCCNLLSLILNYLSQNVVGTRAPV